ncbi:hypothetical protein [Rhodopirellula halodulae]|nr:hypothetical protein [Rhodopirellula sp. JC737]MCC9656998.1 hypothetical protein [Rhodopirellula sp. JC737]
MMTSCMCQDGKWMALAFLFLLLAGCGQSSNSMLSSSNMSEEQAAVEELMGRSNVLAAQRPKLPGLR